MVSCRQVTGAQRGARWGLVGFPSGAQTAPGSSVLDGGRGLRAYLKRPRGRLTWAKKPQSHRPVGTARDGGRRHPLHTFLHDSKMRELLYSPEAACRSAAARAAARSACSRAARRPCSCRSAAPCSNIEKACWWTASTTGRYGSMTMPSPSR